MKLLLVNQSRDRMHRAWLERWVKGLTRELVKRRLGAGARTGGRGRAVPLAKRELVVVFMDRAEMKRLNHQYRQKDYATDVLSFESVEPGVVGELVLCWPVIKEQSRRTGLGERGELGYMMLHGVLHLLGYDHEEKSDEAAMFALQDEIYARLEKSVGLGARRVGGKRKAARRAK